MTLLFPILGALVNAGAAVVMFAQGKTYLALNYVCYALGCVFLGLAAGTSK